MNKTAKLQSVLLRMIVILSAFLTVGALICIIAYILVMGVPNLSLDLFAFEYNSENVSLFPALINTITMTLCTLLIAVPLGIFSAVYLEEGAKTYVLAKLLGDVTELPKEEVARELSGMDNYGQ